MIERADELAGQHGKPTPTKGRLAMSCPRTPIFFLVAAVSAVLLLAPSSASAASGTFMNVTTITIPKGGKASPYPSPISVQGMPGRITDVIVSLRNFQHANPGEVDVLLVSPSGDASVVMSDSCRDEVATRTWTFSESLGGPMPFAGLCDGFFYSPTDYFPGDVWPDAPIRPHVADFDRFLGDDPNGTWRLYVYDDDAPTNCGGFCPPSSGNIASGWTLTIETEVPDALVPGPGQGGLATPYPIARTVTGLDGLIVDVDVSLSGIFHARPDDLDLLLVGPRGQQVMLMSDACGASPAKRANWGWDDEAGAAMNDSTGCASGVSYRPTDREPGDGLPGPAPAGPYAPGLSAFDLTDPNGEWRLYAYDDQPAEADGFFVQRFQLDIETRPRASVAFTHGALELPEGTTRAVTIRRDAPGDVGPASVTVSSVAGSATAGADFTPVSATIQFGQNEREKTVSLAALADGAAEPAETFALALSEATGDAALGTPARLEVTIPASEASGGGGGGTPPPPPPPPVLCSGKRATIVGTAGADVLRGTARADVIAALGGNDRVTGAGGNDLVCAGPGADSVAGNAGRDRLLGGAGNDRLFGGAGVDLLRGETGRDRCDGGPARDRVSCEVKRNV